MSKLLSALNWYQKKIATYDKQLWEKSVDRRISRGLCAIPKKLARIKTELIDVDLVQGSAFPKAKPQHSWIAATLSGILRVLFLPIYFSWWKVQTNSLVSIVLVVLYILQIFSMYLYFSATETEFAVVPTSEALMPIVMMLLLGVVHSQIVATFSNKSPHKQLSRTKRKKVKRKVRRISSGEYETRSSPDTGSDTKSKCSRCSQQPRDISDFHCLESKTQNGAFKSAPQNNGKVSDDEESGLDVRDSTLSITKRSSHCEIHHESSCICCDTSSKNDSRKTHIRKTRHNTDSKENESSEEEFFVVKKPLLSNEEWKKYIMELKHNARKKYNTLKKRTPGNCRQSETRRFSDLGPSSNFAAYESYREGSVTPSFTDPCVNYNSAGVIIESRNSKCMDYHIDVKRNGIASRCLYQQNLHISKDETCLSSGDSGPDTATPDTPMKVQTSDLEWPLITNTDCNSDSSESAVESSNQDEMYTSPYENPFAWEIHENVSPNAGCPSSDKGSQLHSVSCTIWEGNECKKADLSVLDISSAIIRKVDSSVYSTEYMTTGLLFSVVISILPLLFRLQSGTTIDTIQDVTFDVINFTVPSSDDVLQVWNDMMEIMLGSKWRMQLVVFIGIAQRFTLSFAYFFLLAVAEKTFKQRFLYAKHFSYLTSSRRARRSDLPHFRLNKVRNIKTWLSVRSYLKKLGPQRSVDVTVSIAFVLEVGILSFLCVQLLREAGPFASKLHHWETLFWTLTLGFFLLRFMIIGSKINKKYRNLSVLITEQINLYLHMEQKPHKKEELMLANSVLKLAADLLKELESPFKISGLCANPYLYNVTKVVVLSAFSAVLTEILGFKLKLYKIKILN